MPTHTLTKPAAKYPAAPSWDIRKSRESSALLVADLRCAHKLATLADPVMEIVLFDLLSQAATLAAKIKQFSDTFD